MTYNFDEGSTLFITRPGELINDETMGNFASKEQLLFTHGPIAADNDFYIGGATEKFTGPGFQHNDKHWIVFGWAQLKADASGKL
jgi:hypothetical protein